MSPWLQRLLGNVKSNMVWQDLHFQVRMAFVSCPKNLTKKVETNMGNKMTPYSEYGEANS